LFITKAPGVVGIVKVVNCFAAPLRLAFHRGSNRGAAATAWGCSEGRGRTGQAVH